MEESEPVKIVGASGALADNVRAHLGIKDDRIPVAFSFGSNTLESWQQKTRHALQALGYFSPEIRIARKQLDEAERTVVIDLKPGPPTLIETFEVRLEGPGKDDPWFREYLDDLPLQSGDRLNQGSYETIKSRLFALANEYGYFQARLERHKLVVNPETHSADIHLVMATGPRNHLGAITLETDALTPELLSRFRLLEEGEAFDNNRIFEQQQLLQQSGYFRGVVVETNQDPEQPLITNLVYKLEPAKRYQIKFNTGYSTDLGARVGFTLNNRRINRNGNHYNLSAQIAQQGHTFNFDYVIPGQNPVTDNLTLNFQRLREEDDLGDNVITWFGPVWNRQLANDWLNSYSLRYGDEDFSGRSGQDLHSKYLLAAISLRNVEKDHPLFVTEGHRWSFEVLGTTSATSDPSVDFLQFRFDNKWVLPLWADHRLLLRGHLGSTLIKDEDFLDALPPSLRFRIGGDNTLRGYDYNSVGTRNSDGNLLGGKHLAAGSIEYEIPVVDRWAVAAFVDAGDAFIDKFDIKRSVGIGVRWQSPVGPVRLDLAKGLDDPEEFRIHISLGPDL